MDVWGFDGADSWFINEGGSETIARRRPRRNPFLSVIGNPGGGSKMARKRNTKGRFIKGGRRRHGTPRRARSKTRRAAPRRTTRRRVIRRKAYRRNPAGFGGIGSMLPSMKEIGAGVGGAAITRLAPGLLASQFPQIPTTGPAGIGVKAIVVIVAGVLAKMIAPKSIADGIVLGGLIVIGDEIVREYLEPAIGVGEYMGAGSYMPIAGGVGYAPSPGELSGGGYDVGANNVVRLTAGSRGL